jgi:hypothetical protein
MTTAAQSLPNKRRRRWLRFRLRTLMVLLTIASVFLGWQSKRARDQKAAVAAILRIGGTVRYTFQFADDGAFQEDFQPAAPRWLRRLAGEDFFVTVCDVSLYKSWLSNSVSNSYYWNRFSREGTDIEVTDEMLAHLKRLPRLTRLFIHSTTPDAGLETIGAFSQLERLNYLAVTDAGVAHVVRLANLKHLSLNGPLSDRAVAELARLKRLEVLYLSSDEITDAGLVHLEHLPALKTFKLESFMKSGVTTEGMARLRRALPKAELSARLINHMIYPPVTSPTAGRGVSAVRTTGTAAKSSGKQ